MSSSTSPGSDPIRPGPRTATAEPPLGHVADPTFLTTQSLPLRLQQWALGRAHPDFAEIYTTAQTCDRGALAALIRSARPELSRVESNRRATDIDVVQNGVWLTALLGLDRASIRRSVTRCEEIALQ